MIIDTRVANNTASHDYNSFLMKIYCMVSYSDKLPEDSSFFTSIGHPFLAIFIHTSTECPEVID